MRRRFGAGAKAPAGFDHHIGPKVLPWQAGGVWLAQDAYGVTVDRHFTVVGGNRAWIGAQHGVVLEQVGERARLCHVVYGYELHVGVPLGGGAREAAPDPSKTVNG